jgi:Sulfotransferase family
MTNQSPFFIVGVPRSGTTLMAVLLNNHSQIYVGKIALGLSLLKLQRRIIESYVRHGDMRSRTAAAHLLEALKSEKLIWQFCQNVSHKADEGLCRLLAHAREDVVHRHGKMIWGNKSPFMLTEFPRIAHLMPGVRFIHVIRDGRAVALSRYERRNLPLKLAIHTWKQMILKGQIDGEILGLKRYLEIRYEDLINNPAPVLGRVCTFLGVEFEERMLDLSQAETTAQPNAYVRPKLDQDKAASWKEKLLPQQIERLEAIAGDLLQALGYELQCYSPEGSFKMLSPLEVIWYHHQLSLRDLLQAKRVAMINQQLVEVSTPLPTRVRRFLSESATQFLSDRMMEQFRDSKLLMD